MNTNFKFNGWKIQENKNGLAGNFAAKASSINYVICAILQRNFEKKIDFFHKKVHNFKTK